MQDTQNGLCCKDQMRANNFMYPIVTKLLLVLMAEVINTITTINIIIMTYINQAIWRSNLTTLTQDYNS